MRSLSLHYGTIQIASVAGESRRITVSGLAKARLLWLFRNFSLLEFSVLSKAQQQLIYEMWNSGRSIPSKETPRDMIGTIEAFSPQFCSPQGDSATTASAEPSARSAQQSSGAKASQRRSERPGSQRLGSESPAQPRARFRLRAGLRGAVSWRAFAVLLLGAAMYLGPRYLPPKHPHAAQPPVAAVEEKEHTRSTASAPSRSPSRSPLRSEVTPAQASAEPAPAQPPAHLAVPVAEDEPVADVAPVPSPATAPVRPPAHSSTPSGIAADLPEAMAHDVSPPTASPKRIVVDDSEPQEVLRATSPKQRIVVDDSDPDASEPQEVLIRVSVDAAGQAHGFAIMRGDAEETAAALEAARLWNFKPCAGGKACEQVLKYTDYGDSHRVQRIR